jgi:hypothetical protein
MIDSFHSSGISSLFQREIISLWIAHQIFLLPALINSAGIWWVPGDLWHFNFSIANSTSKALVSDSSCIVVCISVCLTSLTPFTLDSWEKWFLKQAKILWQSVTISLLLSCVINHGVRLQSILRPSLNLWLQGFFFGTGFSLDLLAPDFPWHNHSQCGLFVYENFTPPDLNFWARIHTDCYVWRHTTIFVEIQVFWD